MACPAITTGGDFLVRALAHLDCQAQTLGSFGFQALAAPGSLAGTVLTALLTLFVAIYAIRLLFGSAGGARDLVNAALKVGIVLTLATSWPAWRVLAVDVLFYGPPSVAAAIMPSTLPDPRSSLPARLQAIDSGMAALTVAGTGRITGELVDPEAGFRSVALPDATGLGWARPVYLASTIGAFALLRIGGGLLLALAPLIAGLLLFDLSRGLFVGWLRGLVFVALGSLGVTIVLTTQVAVMEPWIADALDKRALRYATPTMPTELLALAVAFAVALAGMLFLLGRVAFQSSWALPSFVLDRITFPGTRAAAPSGTAAAPPPPHPSRAVAISESVTTLMRREEARVATDSHVRRIEHLGGSGDRREPQGVPAPASERLGSDHRRSSGRETRSQRSRDSQGPD